MPDWTICLTCGSCHTLAGRAECRENLTAPKSSGCSKIKSTETCNASSMTSMAKPTKLLLSSSFCFLAPSSQGNPQTCCPAARSGRGPQGLAQGARLHPAQGGDKTMISNSWALILSKSFSWIDRGERSKAVPLDKSHSSMDTSWKPSAAQNCWRSWQANPVRRGAPEKRYNTLSTLPEAFGSHSLGLGAPPWPPFGCSYMGCWVLRQRRQQCTRLHCPAQPSSLLFHAKQICLPSGVTPLTRSLPFPFPPPDLPFLPLPLPPPETGFDHVWREPSLLIFSILWEAEDTASGVLKYLSLTSEFLTTALKPLAMATPSLKFSITSFLIWYS